MSDMEINSLQEQEQTRVMPAVEGEAAPRRRRRSDRYTDNLSEEAARPETAGESETAREVARRLQLEEEGHRLQVSLRGGTGAGRTAGTVRPVDSRTGPARGGSSRAAMSGAMRPGYIRDGSGAGRENAGYVREGTGHSRENMGYAPGRMNMGSMERGRISEESRARIAEENRGRQEGANPYSGYPQTQGEEKRHSGRHRVLTALVVFLLVIGAALIGLHLIPENAVGILGDVKSRVTGLLRGDRKEAPQVIGFLAGGQEDTAAPADISFSVSTKGSVEDVRLVDRNGEALPTRRTIADGGDETLWNLTWRVEEAWIGEIRLQILSDGNWLDTEQTASVYVSDPPAEEPEAQTSAELPVVFATEAPTETPETSPAPARETATQAENETGERIEPNGDEETPKDGHAEGGEPAEMLEITEDEDLEITEDEELADDEEPVIINDAEAGEDNQHGNGNAAEEPVPELRAGAAPLTEKADASSVETAEETDPGDLENRKDPDDPGDPENRNDPDDPGNPENRNDPDDPGDPVQREAAAASTDVGEAALSASAGDGAEEGVQPESPAQAKAPGTPAETESVSRPLMTVSAGENADPSLISAFQIYNGTKKVKEYARADKEKVQMPVLGEYTRQQMGVLTFRTDAFRQNAAVGAVKGMDNLEIKWTAEAGSVKGASQTYYGVGWTGQPAIVKWGKEVREASDMYDAKREKSGLREVIVAGLDGRIYFLDLVDGTATRNSIKVGYPMKGTPSVHPGGAPYINAGQFARKMASGRTGTIGLRQYNLYNMKELSLIDGLDAKNNRVSNKIGSFETSALISRVSNVMVTAGTNGLLYVVTLNQEFDYVAGVYQQSPTFVLLRSRAKGESDAQTAVEASVAMYDHYVYYADMGGYLRCVDTNTMTVSWAVPLGDSVESTPALDWHGDDGLDLYTATELSLRKKGDAEIRCLDALSGEERWMVNIGVQKDKKNKTVSGFRASPVVGQNALSEYVYYTVNNLSAEGCQQLGLSGDEEAALIAIRKSNGGIVWAFGLSGQGYSSPVAVYDENGNGSIIQCAGDGSVTMLDGLTGKLKASLQIDGAIEASPAVYNNILVVATSEKNKNSIYGITIN